MDQVDPQRERLLARTPREGEEAPPLMIRTNDKKALLRRGYRIGLKLGAGAHGQVFWGKWHQQKVAIKLMYLKSLWTTPKDFFAVVNELSVLKNLRHPNLVRYLDCYFLEAEEQLLIFMEFLDGGDLRKLLNKFETNEAQTKVIYRQIGAGLAYMHQRGIAHRDLKPENILLSGDLQAAKLADFGLAITGYELETGEPIRFDGFAGTARYMAPELTAAMGYLQGKNPIRPAPYCPFRADVWSIGVILFEVLNLRVPFPTFDLWVFRVTRRSFCGLQLGVTGMPEMTFARNVSRSARSFVRRHLTWLPEDRPEMDQLMADSWLKQPQKRRGTV